jgi:hypothetical protein
MGNCILAEDQHWVEQMWSPAILNLNFYYSFQKPLFVLYPLKPAGLSSLNKFHPLTCDLAGYLLMSSNKQKIGVVSHFKAKA